MARAAKGLRHRLLDGMNDRFRQGAPRLHGALKSLAGRLVRASPSGQPREVALRIVQQRGVVEQPLEGRGRIERLAHLLPGAHRTALEGARHPSDSSTARASVLVRPRRNSSSGSTSQSEGKGVSEMSSTPARAPTAEADQPSRAGPAAVDAAPPASSSRPAARGARFRAESNSTGARSQVLQHLGGGRGPLGHQHLQGSSRGRAGNGSCPRGAEASAARGARSAPAGTGVSGQVSQRNPERPAREVRELREARAASNGARDDADLHAGEPRHDVLGAPRLRLEDEARVGAPGARLVEPPWRHCPRPGRRSGARPSRPARDVGLEGGAPEESHRARRPRAEGPSCQPPGEERAHGLLDGVRHQPLQALEARVRLELPVALQQQPFARASIQRVPASGPRRASAPCSVAIAASARAQVRRCASPRAGAAATRRPAVRCWPPSPGRRGRCSGRRRAGARGTRARPSSIRR